MVCESLVRLFRDCDEETNNRPFRLLLSNVVADLNLEYQFCADAILSLLAIEHAPEADAAATLTIRVAGDGALRLEVDCIDVVLRDLSAPWPAASGRAPSHEGDAPGS